MSIVRVGLSEARNFAEGYEAIFAKKKNKTNKKATVRTRKRTGKMSARKK